VLQQVTMMKKVLITGGLGFIGYPTALTLLKSNFEVVVLDNLAEKIHSTDDIAQKLNTLKSYAGFSFIHGDVRKFDHCKTALANCNFLIHLAAETGTGESMYEIAQYVDTNVNGTAVLLDVIAKENIKLERIILSSSRSVYGEGKYACLEHGIQFPLSRNRGNIDNQIFEPVCTVCNKELHVMATDEESLINPLSIYATTKRQQEELVCYAYSILNIPYSIFRYQNVYGAGQSLQNPYTGILSIFSTRIRNKKSIEIFEDGKESRDFVYIDDVVNATILPILNPSERNEVINVGTGTAISVYEVASEIMNILKIKVDLIITGKSRAGDIRHNIADISKLKETYNFTPKYIFESGLKKFIDWVLQQSIATDNYETAITELKEKGLYK
jgi:dTDP-L-rhamnose 4-epimerase